MSSVARFDDWQFQNHYQTHPVSVESKLSFADYGRMSTQHRAQGRRWVPPFAKNGKQLQRVLLVRVWRYCHSATPAPENIDWQQLNKAAQQRVLSYYKIRATSPTIQKEMHAQHVAAVIKCGGYLQLQAACAYRGWLLGENSVSVGESLGISPNCVRVILQRLRDIARSLGYDCGQPHPTYRSKRHSALLKKAWRQRKQTGG
jgi:hypothetical protein